jgi:deoxycytidylate deaminase
MAMMLAAQAQVLSAILEQPSNEVPAVGGGPYWDSDLVDARDHAYDKKTDSNYLHQSRIVKSIVDNLQGVLLTEENARSVLKKLDKQATDPQVDESLNRISDMVATHSQVNEFVRSSELKEITEYGRAVHAEMDALLTCARRDRL